MKVTKPLHLQWNLAQRMSTGMIYWTGTGWTSDASKAREFHTSGVRRERRWLRGRGIHCRMERVPRLATRFQFSEGMSLPLTGLLGFGFGLPYSVLSTISLKLMGDPHFSLAEAQALIDRWHMSTKMWQHELHKKLGFAEMERIDGLWKNRKVD